MTKKTLIAGVLLILPLIALIISCQKENLSNEDKATPDFRIPFKKMAGSCSGSETKETTITVDLSDMTVKKKVEYFCDGLPLSVYHHLVDPLDLGKPLDSTENDPAPPASYSPCSNDVTFDVNNIFHYNNHLSALDKAVISSAFDQIMTYYNVYPGPYVLADLDMYGPGSNEKLIHAAFGYICSSVLGSSKFSSLVNNVPSSYVFYTCDNLLKKNACLTGIAHFSTNPSSMTNVEDIFNYFITEIAAHRM